MYASPEPRSPSHRTAAIELGSGVTVANGRSTTSATGITIAAANVTWNRAGIIGCRPWTLRRA